MSTFILAMRGRNRANKNEIGIFVSSVTSNDFPHAKAPFARLKYTIALSPSEIERLFNMLRKTILVAFLLWAGQTNGFATDRYGEWSLEKLNRNATALLNRDMHMMGDKVLTAELALTCNRQSKAFGASLIPPEGTYHNQQRDVPVSVQKSTDNVISSDLSQNWQNGFKYVFLNDQDKIQDLMSFLSKNERNGADFVHFFFPGDFNGKPDALNHVVISLAGFSEGFARLNATCKR